MTPFFIFVFASGLCVRNQNKHTNQKQKQIDLARSRAACFDPKWLLLAAAQLPIAAVGNKEGSLEPVAVATAVVAAAAAHRH